MGGDSGYDDHFKMIGEKYGPIDLAILDNGQYDKNWKYIHMLPEETVQAAADLHASRLLAFHNSKFALANHAWDDPLKRASHAAADSHLKLLTPMIGEAVMLDEDKLYSRWWEGQE